MARPIQQSATTRSRTILYVAASETAASDGAARLETVASGSGPDRSVRSATTVEQVETVAAAVDCVVFAETPTTAAGSNLLEVVAACGSTPVVLFSDGSFTPGAARSTDGIDGYVRSDTDDAVVHLADEIEWVCRDRTRTATNADANADTAATDHERLRAIFRTLPDPAVWYELEDGRPVVRAATDAVGAVFGIDPDELVGEPVDERLVPSGLEHRRATLREALQAGERRQFERRHDTVDGVREFRVRVVPLESAGSDAGTDTDRADPAGEGVLVYTDTTEHRRCDRTRAAADARLEAIVDLLDDDVWPSLNVARSYLDLAADTGDDDHVATVADAQERVREGLERLAAIAEQNGGLVDTEPVAVHDIARRAWTSIDTGDRRLVTRDASDRVLEANKAGLRALFEGLFRIVVTDTTTAVTVGAIDDGFAIAQHVSKTDTDAIGGLEPEPVPSRSAIPDENGDDLEAVECIADAHGWTVDVVDYNGRLAIACRDIGTAEKAVNGI